MMVSEDLEELVTVFDTAARVSNVKSAQAAAAGDG